MLGPNTGVGREAQPSTEASPYRWRELGHRGSKSTLLSPLHKIGQPQLEVVGVRSQLDVGSAVVVDVVAVLLRLDPKIFPPHIEMGLCPQEALTHRNKADNVIYSLGHDVVEF